MGFYTSKESAHTSTSEHLKRVHSSTYWCLACKTRLPTHVANKSKRAKKSHEACRGETPWPVEMEEYARKRLMTAEQEESWGKRPWYKSPGDRGNGSGGDDVCTWVRIYKSLYPNDTEIPPSSKTLSALLPSATTGHHFERF